LGHELERAAARQLFRGEGRQFECGLIDPEENHLRMGRGLAAFALEKILEVLFLPPDGREKWEIGKKVHRDDHAGAERANRRHHETPMTTKPMHARDFRRRAARGQCENFRDKSALSSRAERSAVEGPGGTPLDLYRGSSTALGMTACLHQSKRALLFRPANARWRREICSPGPACGTKSANEVAQIIN